MKASTIIEKLCNLFSLFGFLGYVPTDQGSNFMSSELKRWLYGKGIPTSRSTRCNPKGNGQVERFSGVIWKSVLLWLRVKNLPTFHWETVLCVLHSLQSLLCTATNCTPYERMFLHLRKSANGVTMPTWLKPGPVYVKCHVGNKGDIFVDDAELIEANPQYVHVKLNNGCQTAVFLRDLAPHPQQINCHCRNPTKTSVQNTLTCGCVHFDNLPLTNNESLPSEAPNTTLNKAAPSLRRSSRLRRPVIRYGL